MPGVVCITELPLFTYKIPPFDANVTGWILVAVCITDDWLACITDEAWIFKWNKRKKWKNLLIITHSQFY